MAIEAPKKFDRYTPVEMDDADPCTSSAKELVEKRRLRGSLHRVVDSPPASSGAAPPRTDGAGAELESRAKRSGFVAARVAERGMDSPATPPEVLCRAPPPLV